MNGIITNDEILMSVINIEENTARDFVFKFYPIFTDK